MRQRRSVRGPHAVPITGVLLLLSLSGGPALPREQDPGPSTTDELVERLDNAWYARDFEGYLALWEFDSAEDRKAEAAASRAAFAAEETRLTVLGAPRYARGSARLSVDVRVFTATEPRGRVDYWRLVLERRGRRFAFVKKEVGADMDGLVHLPLDPEAWRVRGVLLQLEDMELRMEDGSLFSTPESVGRTAFVFVGRGRVRFAPGPPAEAEQLRQFAGEPVLERGVKWAFFRLHPGDFEELIDATRLQPDPGSSRRLKEAARRWSERSGRSFIVDAPLPGSPWWITPSPGDALVEFPWKGGRVLTYARAFSEAEDVNLFDRDHQLKICSYPSAGRPDRRRGERQGAVDILHHELVARFEPSRRALNAVDAVRMKLRTPTPTLRFALHDDFELSSVSADGGERLLFFRVREQGQVVVSLGPHATREDEFTLTFRYSGRHDPAPVSQELLQLFPEPQPAFVDRALLGPPPLVYSNRTAWYPRTGGQEYATLRAHLDTPEGEVAITGGRLLGVRTAEGRTRATYDLRRPGKFFTVVLGAFEDLGMRQLGEQQIRGFSAARTEGETRKNMVVGEEILAFYSELYGPCPYPVINQVSAEGYTPAGHSPPGLVYLQRRPPTLATQRLAPDPANFSNMPDFFLAHELAHQWWGQGVAPATYREQWLSEAWAQYSAALWARRQAGEEPFRGMLDRMAGWALKDDHHGPIHLGQRLGHLKKERSIQRSIVYNKGACVLHMLRQLLGDEAFFGGARAFLEGHLYRGATTEDLRAAFEKASGRDLAPYFEQWVYGTGVPELRWAARTEETPDGFRTTVGVAAGSLPGPLPLEIRVKTRGAPVVTQVELDPSGGSWTVFSADLVRDVGVNEDRGILAEVKEVERLPGLPHR